MEFSQVSHLLEVLARNGVTDNLVRRFRLDADFAKTVSDMAIAEYLGNPGTRYAIDFDRSKNRGILVAELRQRHRFMTLRDDIIREITPLGSNQPRLFNGQPVERMELFLTRLFTDATEKEAIAILDEMNLESASFEEAITLAIQRRTALSQDYTIVVLAAKYFDREDKEESFFDLGVTMAGDPTMGLTNHTFGPGTRFLTKRKKPLTQG